MTDYTTASIDDLRGVLAYFRAQLNARVYDDYLLPGQRAVIVTIIEMLMLAMDGATPEQARGQAVTVITLVEAGQFAQIVARTGELMAV